MIISGKENGASIMEGIMKLTNGKIVMMLIVFGYIDEKSFMTVATLYADDEN